MEGRALPVVSEVGRHSTRCFCSPANGYAKDDHPHVGLFRQLGAVRIL